jgi:hypothetical protein
MSEIEQRQVIKFLYAKKFALDRIVEELALVDGGQSDANRAVEYWIRQVKLRRSDLEDEAKHGGPPLDDVDVRILAYLSHEPFSSIRSVVPALSLAPATPCHIPGHATSTLPVGSPYVDLRTDGSAGTKRPSTL